ncbi:MAG TPA: magnesium/cobalt transporter CorA [Dehalococcoidia bacterium]|nr:magnesium/cobalt transporter CorA [Dehalococcoidia bacterium]
MIRSAYRDAAGDVRFDLAPEALRRAACDESGLLWVDLEAEPRASGEPLLRDVFGFHELTIDDCYNTLIDPPKVDDYRRYLFLIVHAVRYDEAAQRLGTTELDLYLGAHFVVTFHHLPLRSVDDVWRRAERRNLVLDDGADFLAHALIDVVVDEFHPVVETLDEQVALIEEVVIDRPQRETLQEVLRLKRNAQRLKRSILPQRDVVNRFSRGEYPHLVRPERLMYFRDVYDHTVRVEETIEGLRDLADSALNTYLSAVNNRINEVMKTLAIVTVIFLPLTLIAGIYGTNFRHLPEYTWRWGYFGMLGAMAVIAVGLIAWFRWRRWI